MIEDHGERAVVFIFFFTMDRTTNNLKSLAKRTIDLSTIGFELGFYRNPCGNFSLIHLDNGNWLCHMRIFQYWIDGDKQGYWTNDTM